MTTGRMPAGAAAGWSARASPGPGQLLPAARDPGPVPSPQLSQAKGKRSPTRGTAQPRAPRTQSSRAPRGCSSRQLGQRTPALGTPTSAPRPRLQHLLMAEAGIPRPRALIGWMGHSWAGHAAPLGFGPASPGAPPFGPQAVLRAKRAAWVFLALFKGFGLTVPDSALGLAGTKLEQTGRWFRGGPRFRSPELQDLKVNLLIFQMEPEAWWWKGFPGNTHQSFKRSETGT